ncbi:MAG: hypothetical protein ACREMD_04325 [Gemmatimonadota bacterium]
MVQVKALACELPSRRERPLARWSIAELAGEVRRSGLVATISATTVWRWMRSVPGNTALGSSALVGGAEALKG